MSDDEAKTADFRRQDIVLWSRYEAFDFI